MKKLILLMMLIIVSLNATSQKQRKSWSLGYSGGYAFDTRSTFLCVDYRYSATKSIRLSPSVRQFYRIKGYKGGGMDTDIHYVIPLSEIFIIYPFAGGNFTYWDYYDEEKKSHRKGKHGFGGNIGLGLEIQILDDIIIGLEAKYNSNKVDNQAIGGLRIGYIFKQ